MKISCIVAADEKNGIGKDNQLLCYLPNDLKYFKNLTTHHTILMGRKTFESIGKALPNRTNIVISSNTLTIENVIAFKSIEEGINFAKQHNEDELFIIGGDSIYKQCMSFVDTVYLTRIHHRFDADAFFPSLTSDEWALTKSDLCKVDEKNKFEHSFQTYIRK